MFRKIKLFFKSDKIIYSLRYQPGKKLFSFRTNTGKQYVRIAFTNKVKFAGTMPVTDILFSDITGVRVLPSPFKKWLYGLFKKKPASVFHTFIKTKTDGTK